jgi:hypothetical protein
MVRGSRRSVPVEGEAPVRDPLDRIDLARVLRPVAHERRVDAVRHGVAERERISRQEQRARCDGKTGD